MRCRFCNSPATSLVGTCRVCGARLLPPSPKSTSTSRPLQPLAPVPLNVEISTRPPELLARISREKDAPRIVSIGFLSNASGQDFPILVLDHGELQMWNIERGLLSVKASRHFAKRTAIFTTCAAFSLFDSVVATGHESGHVLLHQLEPRAPGNTPKSRTTSLAAHRGRVLSLAFTESRLWSAGSDGAILSFVLPASKASIREQIVLDGLAWLRCVAVSTDGARLAIGGENGELQMWRISPEGTLETREWARGCGEAALQSLAFSRSGQMLIGTDATGNARLWAAQTGHELQVFTAQTRDEATAPPVLAPDNRLLAVPGIAREIRLFDAWTGTTRAAILLPFERAQALAFAPLSENGERYICLSIAGAGEVMLWKIGLH